MMDVSDTLSEAAIFYEVIEMGQPENSQVTVELSGFPAWIAELGMSQNEISLYEALREKFNEQLQPQLQCKTTLMTLSHALEEEVLQNRLAPVIFTSFQDVRYYQSEVARYQELESIARSVTLFGRNLSHNPTFEKEWFVVINEPRFKALMACYEVEPTAFSRWGVTPDEKIRPFVGIWSYEREVVDYATLFLVAHASPKAVQAVEEVLSQPHHNLEQMRFVSNISDRILTRMESMNRRVQTQVSHNKHLQTGIAEVDSARQIAENERDSLHTELKRLYDELTRSQTIMAQAVIDKARLEQTLQLGASLLSQLEQQIADLTPSDQTLRLLTQLQALLSPVKPAA
jgi:DICT domain-containing protein